MIIDLMAWAPSRAQFVQGLLENKFCTLAEDGSILPAIDVAIDEIGPITKVPATYDGDMNELSPAVVIPGWHANLRAYGMFAEQVAYGLPQVGPDGEALSVFERTYLLHLVRDLSWTELKAVGVPPGWEGRNGVRLFDPGTVSRPTRVWA